jgi:hypothetical protein
MGLRRLRIGSQVLIARPGAAKSVTPAPAKQCENAASGNPLSQVFASIVEANGYRVSMFHEATGRQPFAEQISYGPEGAWQPTLGWPHRRHDTPYSGRFRGGSSTALSRPATAFGAPHGCFEDAANAIGQRASNDPWRAMTAGMRGISRELRCAYALPLGLTCLAVRGTTTMIRLLQFVLWFGHLEIPLKR